MQKTLKNGLAPFVGLARLPRRLAMRAMVSGAFARAAATAAAREIDPARPQSWEFAGFSQHGEDGLHDYLCARIRRPNRFFVEIGAADGLHNCSAWLAFARRYGGVMVEADTRLARRARQAMREFGCHNVLVVPQRVDRENISAVTMWCPYPDPDVLIVDVDGVDYHIVERVLSLGLTPRVITVEYNSAFGPDRAVTVPYDPNFSRHTAHRSLLYYGASITAWRRLLARHGYQFVTVESNGVNAFFIRPDAFPTGFCASLESPEFLENRSDRNAATEARQDNSGAWSVPARDWRAQFAMISHLALVEVD